jgi:hypothetical protein
VAKSVQANSTGRERKSCVPPEIVIAQTFFFLFLLCAGSSATWTRGRHGIDHVALTSVRCGASDGSWAACAKHSGRNSRGFLLVPRQPNLTRCRADCRYFPSTYRTSAAKGERKQRRKRKSLITSLETAQLPPPKSIDLPLLFHKCTHLGCIRRQPSFVLSSLTVRKLCSERWRRGPRLELSKKRVSQQSMTNTWERLLDVLQISDVGKQGPRTAMAFGAHTSFSKTESPLVFKRQQHLLGKHFEHPKSRASGRCPLFETPVRVLFWAIVCASDARWESILANGERCGPGAVWY